MQSPIAQMQRAWYPQEPHPLAGFGDLTQGITGVKAGVTAGGIATSVIGGVASAVGAGAAAGSVVPIIGTAIGAIVGLVASGVFNRKVDPEVGNFNNAVALTKAQGAQAVLGIQDKYLVLAGLFDLHPDQIKGNIPIYKKYGRMGEHQFVMDMCALIQHAADQGIITANDTVQSVYDKVVAPWIAGFGYGPMQDANAEMINTIILGLIGEYVSGQFKTRWYARGGDFAFNSLPLFKLPSASATTPTTSGTPVPTSAPGGFAPAGFTVSGQAPNGATLYSQPGDPHVYTWTNGQMVVYTPTAANPQQSAVPVPAGFTLVGSANNLPAYQGADGYFYSWSGTTMSPLTGVLTASNGQSLSVQGGAVVPSNSVSSPLPSLTSNTQAGVSPYASTGGTPYVPLPTVASPNIAPVQPVAAGVSGAGLPSWVSWGAVAGVAGLMLMSARRAPATRRYRPRAPR